MSESALQILGDFQSLFIYILAGIFVVLAVIVLGWVAKKLGLDIRIWKLRISKSPDKNQEEGPDSVEESRPNPANPGSMFYDTRKIHANCPLVGDVVLVVNLVKQYSYDVYKLRYKDCIREQMKFADQHLVYLFEMIGREYEDALKDPSLLIEDSVARDLMSLCRSFGIILMDRYLSFLRDCFVDNGLEDYDEVSWKDYKKTQSSLLLSRGQTLLTSLYPHCLVRGVNKNPALNFSDFFNREAESKVLKELGFIFDNARDVVLEYKKKELKLSEEFSNKLGQILEGKYTPGAEVVPS